MPGARFPIVWRSIHRELTAVIRDCAPECVAIENLFHATNVRSALLLGHARGVAMLAAVEAGLPVVEYTPAEIKRAVVGYGRAEKAQVQRMMKLLLGLDACRRRMTPPMRWRWPSATCTRALASRGPRPSASRSRGKATARRLRPAVATSWRSYRPGRRLPHA